VGCTQRACVGFWLCAAPLLLSGVLSQVPIDTCQPGPGGHCILGTGTAVAPPFAEATLWALSLLPAACDKQGGEGCKWQAVPDTWRYVFSNLRLAISHADAERRGMLTSEIMEQLNVIHDFMEQLGDQTGYWIGSWHNAAPAARAVMDAFMPWLEGYRAGPPLRIVRGNTGVVFPSFSGRSLQVSTDGDTAATTKLANGVGLPILGFGVWQLPADGTTRQAVMWALEAGYRHIDTAQGYGNEHEVGSAIKASNVPRSAISIVTKLSEPKEFRTARFRFESQLKTLGVDYIDVYMLHSPGYGKEDREAAWRQMEELYDEGKIRALGVSNFNIEQLEELFAFARIKPVYIQNKYSIYQPGGYDEARSSTSLMEWLNEHKVVMTGYSIIHPAHGGLLSPMDDPHVRKIAARHGRTPSQILHRWLLQLGAVVIPRSRNRARIIENSQLFNFALPDTDVRLLNGLASLVKSTPKQRDPAWCEDVYGVGAFSTPQTAA